MQCCELKCDNSKSKVKEVKTKQRRHFHTILDHEFPGNSREVPANMVFLFWKDREWYDEAKSVNNEDSRGMSREADRSRQNGLLLQASLEWPTSTGAVRFS